MFCYQCEQTAKGEGCVKIGVCGKNDEVSGLQDLLIHALTGLAQVAQEAAKAGVAGEAVDAFTFKALFATLTNVNFDVDRIAAFIRETAATRDALAARVKHAGGAMALQGPALFVPGKTVAEMVDQAKAMSLKPRADVPADISSLQHILLFATKGVAAYADHAKILGKYDPAVAAFVYKALTAPLDPDLTANDWVALVLECGKINILAMELLDAANTSVYGHPVPTSVPLGHKEGKAILVSGHDLKDLAEILEQTQGKGIWVYTHGEMLPAHGYPALKKYPHFYGHYGTAWQNQVKEFAEFPGAILMTTNCIQKPRESYQANIFTTGNVGYPQVAHVAGPDFSAVVEKALQMPGFAGDAPGKTVTVGFARNAVLGVADKVVEAVKTKAIRHFFLVAGCDGAKPGRNYYTEFVEKVPKDCVVLTLACGKFRFFDKELGDIGGIPRLLDVGQCNDAYSAVRIAMALAEAFGVGINDLPLSMILSWYEQKAVAILLSLFYLGIQNIRLGPSLPAFITPGVLDVLVKNFNIKPITTPDADLKAILGA